MKKSLLLVLVLTTYFTFANDDDKSAENVNEIGLTFRNLNSFGGTYRFGKENSV